MLLLVREDFVFHCFQFSRHLSDSGKPVNWMNEAVFLWDFHVSMVLEIHWNMKKYFMRGGIIYFHTTGARLEEENKRKMNPMPLSNPCINVPSMRSFTNDNVR